MNRSQSLRFTNNEDACKENVLSRLEALGRSKIKIKLKQLPIPLSVRKESNEFVPAVTAETSYSNDQIHSLHQRKIEGTPMSLSVISGTEKRYSTPEAPSRLNTSRSYFEREDENFNRREDMKREIGRLLNQDDSIIAHSVNFDDICCSERKEKEQREAPMYWSIARACKKKERLEKGPNIFEEFVLPKGVGQILEDEEENIKEMENHIFREKYKVNVDLDKILQEVSSMLENQKQILHSRFDAYLDQYKQNYRVLKEKIVQYKEKTKTFFNTPPTKKKFDPHSQQKAVNPVMKKVQFYRVDTNQNNIFKKFKEDICNIEGNATSINREVSRKMIGYLAEELDKQTTHKPLYNHTESTQIMFKEVMTNIVARVKESFDDFSLNMVYITPLEVFGNIFAFPQIESCISEDNLNIVGDSEKLLQMRVNLESSIKFEENVKTMCLRALPADLAAIGCSDGVVRIWNYSNFSPVNFIRAHNSPISAINIMNIQTADLNEYIILTGGSSPDLTIKAWQVSSQKCVRLLKGHKADITSLLPLKDGLTLISASKENQIFVWNMQTSKLFNKLSQHTKQVNGLHLIRDNSRFVSISDDKTMCVWKLIYEYSLQLKKRIVFSCQLEKVFEDTCEITSINSATDNYNIVITGGQDNKIKIWDIGRNSCLKTIHGHSLGIGGLIYFENPFKVEAFDQYMILSLGFNEYSLMMCKSANTFSIPIATDPRVQIKRDLPGNYKMQLVRASRDGNLKIIMIAQGDESNVMLWNLTSESDLIE